MSLREYIHRLEAKQALVKVEAPISTNFEIAGVLKQLEPAPVLFEHVLESPFSSNWQSLLFKSGLRRLLRHPGK